MKIAVLGWGSLIWSPGNLRIRTKWRSDGPALPIEFARISQDNRVTLVIHEKSADQPTYWALSEFTTANEARENLRSREGCSPADVHYLTQDGNRADGVPRYVADKIRDWLTSHKTLDTIIWTGLPCNWMEKRGRNFAPEDAVLYLPQLEVNRQHDAAAFARAREYVTNAPPLIDTAARRALRARGWRDTPLPASLFET